MTRRASGSLFRAGRGTDRTGDGAASPFRKPSPRADAARDTHPPGPSGETDKMLF